MKSIKWSLLFNYMAYLYRHIRLDKDEVFYIGIGGDTKNNYTRAYSKHQRNKHWYSVSKNGFEVEIMFDDLDWDTACNKEKEFIKLYGRKDLGLGTLVNKTDGGEGGFGMIISAETRKKISAASLGKLYYTEEEWMNLEKQKNVIKLLKDNFSTGKITKLLGVSTATIARVRKILIKNKEIFPYKRTSLTKEHSEKISKALKGKKKSKDAIEKSKIGLKKYYQSLSPEEKQSKHTYGHSMRGKTHKKSTKEKMSNASKGKPKSPEHKAKLKEVWKKRKEQKISNFTNNFW